jgi:hypothetical protein
MYPVARGGDLQTNHGGCLLHVCRRRQALVQTSVYHVPKFIELGIYALMPRFVHRRVQLHCRALQLSKYVTTLAGS